MVVITLIILLLIGNWFFSDVFVFYPLKLLYYLGLELKWVSLFLLLALLSWGFRD